MEIADAKQIAIYARVSTARQEEDGTIETQLVALREYAREHGYAICKEYIDEGWSGDLLARPSLDELRQDADRKLWEAVLAYDPDRIARRYSYQELVMDELREAGVELIFVTIAAPKNSEEKILHGVRGLFAEYERAKIAERFRLGKVRKVKEGHLLVSEPAYGYHYIPKNDQEHGYYEINHEEAEVVRLIFDLVANQGCTLRRLVRELQKRGIAPRKSRRGVWSTSTLSKLLRNKVYVGQAHWGKSYGVVPENPIKIDKYRKSKKTSRRIRPESEWHAIPAPAIISEELFERANARLKANFALADRNKKNEYLLAGKIRCVCGRSRSGEGPQGGRYRYYRCIDRVLSMPLPRSCYQTGINAQIADELVWNEISKLMSSEGLILEQARRWADQRNSANSEPAVDVGSIEKEIAALKMRETRYNNAYGAGLYTLEQLRDYLTPVRSRIAELSAKLTPRQREIRPAADPMPSEEEIRQFSSAAVAMLRDLDFRARRGIVLKTIEKVVASQQELKVYGRIPIGSDGAWLAPGDSGQNQKSQSPYVEQHTNDRYGLSATRQSSVAFVPYELHIALPPPLQRGVDYGFGCKKAA